MWSILEGMLAGEERPEPRQPRMLSFKAGQMLCTYGDPPGPLYIVLSGKLLVFRPREDNPSMNAELAQLGPGAIVGEMAAVLGQPRTASVGALASTTVLEVPVSHLDTLARDHTPVARVLVAALHERAGLTHEQIRDVFARWGIEAPEALEADEDLPEPAPGTGGTAARGENSFYTKNVTCPICQTPFVTRVVRSQSDQPRERQSDFHQIYAGPFNPYDYEVWICPTDLYAALSADFVPLSSSQRTLVVAAIVDLVEHDWGGIRPSFDRDRSLALREQSLLLALAICRARSAGASRIAALLHRLAWCSRERDDAVRERSWLGQALQAYTLAHEQADKDLDKEDLRIQYLCGELALRLGDRVLAHRWFANALMQPAAGKHAMWARMIREQLEVAVGQAQPPPDAVVR